MSTQSDEVAREMALMLLDLEWSGSIHASEEPCCPWCRAYAKAAEHDIDCKLASVLVKAGVIADKETRHG
jgi:hypothetical protein